MGRGSEQTVFQRSYVDGQQAHEKIYKINNSLGNANQTTGRYSLMPLEWLLTKRQEIIHFGEDGQKETIIVGKSENWWQSM